MCCFPGVRGWPAFAWGRRLDPAPKRSCAPPVAASRRGPGSGSLVRPLRWPGLGPGPVLPGGPPLAWCFGPAADPGSRRAAVCSRFAAPAAPSFSARQRVPGPAASAPRPGTPFRPGRARLVPKLFPAISLLVGPDRRSSALRPVCGAGVRVQTGVTHTTDPKIRCSGFVFRAVVLGRRVLRAASRARRPCAFGPRPGRTSG